MQILSQASFTEWLAVILGICYVILIARKQRVGWYFALVSSALYVYLSFEAKIYFESFLQSFYCFMAIYGWIQWKKSGNEQVVIQKLPFQKHLLYILSCTVVSLTFALMMALWTDQQSPSLDAFTTTFSLVATFLAAHKVLESWLYWIVIDLALAVLYAQQGLYLVGINYVIFTVIAIFAYLAWRKTYQNQLN